MLDRLSTLAAATVLIASLAGTASAQMNSVSPQYMGDGTIQVQLEGVVMAQVVPIAYDAVDQFGQPYAFVRTGIWMVHQDGSTTLWANVEAITNIEPLDGIPSAANVYVPDDQALHLANWTDTSGTHHTIITAAGISTPEVGLDMHVRNCEVMEWFFAVAAGDPPMVLTTTYLGADGATHTVTTNCPNRDAKKCAKQHKTDVEEMQKQFPPAGSTMGW